MNKRGAASLAAKIKQTLKVEPVMEKGKPGELSVYVGDELLAEPGFLAKSLNIGMNALVGRIGEKLATAKA